MKKRFQTALEAVAIMAILLLLLGFSFPIMTATFFKNIKLQLAPSTIPTAVIQHLTTGKLDFSITEGGVSDLELTGVNHVLTLFDGALADGFEPTSADSDNGLGFAGDIIIDSLRIFSTDNAAADSIRVLTYRNTTVATLISTDTLTANGIIDYTGIAAASRDFDASAAEKPAFFFDEIGTFSDVLIQLFYRTYDVR